MYLLKTLCQAALITVSVPHDTVILTLCDGSSESGTSLPSSSSSSSSAASMSSRLPEMALLICGPNSCKVLNPAFKTKKSTKYDDVSHND